MAPLLSLHGFSIAGVETCIEVPSLGVALDLGRCSATAVRQEVVLLSHGHLDHMGAIAQHAARRAMLKMREGTYIVPKPVHALVEALFNAAGALDGQVIPRRVVPLEPGEEFALDALRSVRPFETFHRVPSQGYTIWERRHRRRAALQGLSGAELVELRRRGTTIDEPFDAPLLSFTGDTRSDVLERVPELQQTQTLVIEATFLDGRVSVEDARHMGHIHLDELCAQSSLLTTKDLVLTHFSARYTSSEIATLIRRLPEELWATVRTLGPGPVE